MPRFSALYDANVLYSAPLRDLLLRLAQTELFHARWTDAIHEEWMASLLEKRPELDRSKIERTRELIDRAVPDCLISGYESLIDSLQLPDPDDRHVLAAAIVGSVDVIVTHNLRDFPADVLDRFGIMAEHPDTFVNHLLDLSSGEVIAQMHKHRASLRNPPKSVHEYLDTLEAHGLVQTVLAVRQYADLL